MHVGLDIIDIFKVGANIQQTILHDCFLLCSELKGCVYLTCLPADHHCDSRAVLCPEVLQREVAGAGGSTPCAFCKIDLVL